MSSVLFVCLGNICRSPCAEGVFKAMIKEANLEGEIRVESCGLGDWHEGQLPDERMRRVCTARGIVLSSRAQAFDPDYFHTFDYILAADRKILSQLYCWATHPSDKVKIHLISAFSTAFKNEEIPDPFYEGIGQFELVVDMIEDSCQGLLDHIKEAMGK